MPDKLLLCPFLVGLVISLVTPSFALEKVKLGTATKTGLTSYSYVLTAEQRGFWKENGLEVEWVPFRGASALMRAVAGGTLSIGTSGSETAMAATARGVPVVMVAEYVSRLPYYIWVRTDSPYRHPRDLKAARVGVTALGGTTHAFGRVMFRAHGIEKEVRFVGAGGEVSSIAGLRGGAFQALVTGGGTTIKLKLEGAIREIASTDDYLPRPWVRTVVFARKDFALSHPDLVRKVIRATLQAADFMRKNSSWAMDLIKSFQGSSVEEAKLAYKELEFNPTGKIDRQGVENARKLYMEYGILPETAPAADEFFTNEYLPAK